LLASLRIFYAAGMPALRAKSLQMTGMLLDEIDRRFPQLQCLTPRDPARRGNQLSLRVHAGREAGRRLFEDLGASGVVADWREPDILRIAPVPLYNRFEELAIFCDILEAAIRRHA
jgi:kynureninase